MTVTLAVLVSPKDAETTQTAQYVDNTGVTIVDKFTVTNVSAAPLVFSANLVISGGTVADSNLIIDSKTLQPKETYLCPELVGQVLAAGTAISTIASGAGLALSAGGRKVT